MLRGTTARPAQPSWQAPPRTALIDEDEDHPLKAHVLAWADQRLQPGARPGQPSARIHAPVLACRRKPRPACAARLVVEWLGVDGDTALAAAEGRAELAMARPATKATMSRAFPVLLDAALDAALAAPDRRRPPQSAMARRIRRGDKSSLPDWIAALESATTPANQRQALWVAVGHLGEAGQLKRLESIPARDAGEARAKARALRWIRAAGVNAGKTTAPHVESSPGVPP